MVQKSNTFHSLDRSCLFRLTSVNKLAQLFFSSLTHLEALKTDEKHYSCWDETKKNGATRRIEAPNNNLKKVQKRIADLLQRIQPPDYLMAPVKKRSYVDNAAVHCGAKVFLSLDIQDFFPSCTSKKVFWFFHTKMECASHVANLLTKLVTFKGHLPQGSPCSPILAYFSYLDMWQEIENICKNSGYSLSIYADDITISGPMVYKKDVWKIKQVLFRHGHQYNKQKERQIIDKPAKVTGVIVSGESLRLPNRQHEKIVKLRRKKNHLLSAKEREAVDRQLRGRHAQASQIQNYSLKG